MAGRNGQQKRDELTSEERLVVSSAFNEKMATTIKIRVVVWKSGTKSYPQLEKREFYADRNTGEEKSGKAKGFNVKDLELIKLHWPEIMAALGNRLPEAAHGPAKDAEGQHGADPVPSAEADF